MAPDRPDLLLPQPSGGAAQAAAPCDGWHVIQHPAVWHRSLATALIVGTVLAAINQGNLILSHGFTHEILPKMGLTYCVPFSVSAFGALGAAHIHAEG